MIFYLSCTGNTRWAATEIQKAINEPLINIAEAISGPCRFAVQENERIGFCFPVHGWRTPRLLRDFISKLSFEKDTKQHFCWALCTAGDDIGLTMDYLNKQLAAISLKATSMFSLIMPESYVGLPFMDVDTPEKEHTKKNTAERHLYDILDHIVSRQPNMVDLYKGKWPWINSKVLGAAFEKFLITDKPFHVTDVCIACGKCAETCPVANIDGGKGKKPVWKHNGRCLTCFSCYHHCPVHAIEFGKQTKNKGQYLYY